MSPARLLVPGPYQLIAVDSPGTNPGVCAKACFASYPVTSSLLLVKNQIGRLFSDHGRGGLCVAADQLWHD